MKTINFPAVEFLHLAAGAGAPIRRGEPAIAPRRAALSRFVPAR